MISIIVNNENLDLYEENEISFEWTSFAFSKSVKEPYSTDFTIPKTSTNIRLLGLYNLQDETPFDFQEDYIKGVLILDEKPNTVNIQVISVSKDEISIFLVESNPIADFLSKNLVKKFDGDDDGILIDTDDSIFPWWHDSTVNLPNKFVFYSYGHAFNPDYAQIHSSEKLITVLNNAMIPFGIRTANLLKNTDRQLVDKLYIIATNKKVCPQNKKQIIRGQLNQNGSLYVYGGQHVTNDISIDVDEETTIFNVNRSCRISGELSISFHSTHTFRNTPTFSLVNTDDHTVVFSCSLSDVNLYRNYCFQTNINALLSKGNYEFIVTQANNFNNRLAFFLTAEITDYETYKDDEEDLVYCREYGKPIVYDADGDIIEHFHFGTNNVNCTYDRKDKGSSSKTSTNVYFDLYYYSYFGYYCNLPETKIRDLIYNISWMSNSKISFDYNKIIFFNPFNLYNLNNDYEITNTEFTDEHFGKITCFKCKNIELEDVNESDTFAINNKWLNDRVAVKESMFARLDSVQENTLVYGDNNMIVNINQYTDFEYDKDTNTYACKYDEVEGLCIGVLNTTNGRNKYLEPIEYFAPSNIGVTYPHIPRLLLDSVKQIFKVDITIYFELDISKYDFLNIDGRLFYIISGTKNINDGTSNIKALLVNDTEAISFNDNGELVTWQ